MRRPCRWNDRGAGHVGGSILAHGLDPARPGVGDGDQPRVGLPPVMREPGRVGRAEPRRPKSQVETLLVWVPFDPAPAFREPFGITMIAAGTDLGASRHGIPRCVSPFDFRFLCHPARSIFRVSLPKNIQTGNKNSESMFLKKRRGQKADLRRCSSQPTALTTRVRGRFGAPAPPRARPPPGVPNAGTFCTGCTRQIAARRLSSR